MRNFYVCSTYWYPDVEDVDNDIVTCSVDAVYEDMVKALNYQFENIHCLTKPPSGMLTKNIVTLRWDNINNVMELIMDHNSQYKFRITKLTMNLTADGEYDKPDNV